MSTTSDTGQGDRTSWSTARESLPDASDDSLRPDGQTSMVQPAPAAAKSNMMDTISRAIPPNSRGMADLADPDLAYRMRRQRLSQLPLLQDQRHPGKEGAVLARSMKLFELDDGEKPGDPISNTRRQIQTDEEANGHEDESDDTVQGWALFFLITGICLAVFLVSIDRTIMTTAIPYITREFRSIEDIGWYGSAYLLTACAFQPVFGRVYLYFSIKIVYLFALFFFEAGSLICAVAPNSPVLIVGRAVAGFGSAGILTGSFVVVATAIPLQQRPVYTAIVGMMFGIGATAGPLLGGVFTDLVTWRWCFYLNLPVGGATMLAFVIFFRPAAKAQHRLPVLERFQNLDLVGNIIFLGAAVMLFLALELTTQGEPWGTARIIGLLCGFGVTAVLFVVWQWWRRDRALIPPTVVMQRSVAASCILAFLIYAALLAHTYFLPIWFQAILGKSALESGVDMIPYFIVNAFFSILAGVLVSVIGYYVPPCLIGNAIATVGCGLLTLLSPNTTTAEWVGFQILVAAGFGLSIQQGFTAVQTVLPRDQVSIGTAAVVACQSFGGAIFVSVGNNIFQNELMVNLTRNPIPGVDVADVISSGATAFRDLVPKDALPAMLVVYNAALRKVFIATIPLAGLAFFVTFLLEWRSVKVKKA